MEECVCGLVKSFIYSVTVDGRVAMEMMKRVRRSAKCRRDEQEVRTLWESFVGVGVTMTSRWDERQGTENGTEMGS